MDTTCFRVHADTVPPEAPPGLWADTAAKLLGLAAQEIDRLQADVKLNDDLVTMLMEKLKDAEADAVRHHKVSTDRWEALLEMKVRDDQNGSLPPAYRKIIDDALGAPSEAAGK